MKARHSSSSASACIIERADVDELHGFLTTLGAKIIRAPHEDQWAPGYYSILFEDPDGIRLELNHVPGKGLLG
ncbi:MAG: VOC family protein [Tardiphaga sp.]